MSTVCWRVCHVIAWTTVALTLAAVLLFFTPRGLGMSPDSVAYLKSVQGLLQDLGFDYFSIQWPPLYPLAISLVSQLVHHDFYLAARITNGILYGSLFLLVGALLHRTLPRAGTLVCLYIGLFACLVILQPVITQLYFYAFSETLFLVLVTLNLATLHSLTNSCASTKNYLIGILALIGLLATMTRYAGLCLVALNMLIILAVSRNGLDKRNLQGILLQVIPTLLFLFWWRQRLGVGDTEANLRPLSFHPLTFDYLAQGLSNIGGWFVGTLPWPTGANLQKIQLALGVVVVLGLLSLTLRYTRNIYIAKRAQQIPAEHHWQNFIYTSFATGYLTFLVFMRLFFDPNIILDHRTLSPAFIPIVFAVLLSAQRISRATSRFTAMSCLTLILLVPLQTMRPLVLISYFNGIELTDKTRLTSELMEFVRLCPKDLYIHADYPWNFNLEVNSMVRWLPTHRLYGSGQPNLNYQAQVADLARLADLIIVQNLNSAMIDDIEKLHSFTRIYQSHLGIVWKKNSLYNVCVAPLK